MAKTWAENFVNILIISVQSRVPKIFRQILKILEFSPNLAMFVPPPVDTVLLFAYCRKGRFIPKTLKTASKSAHKWSQYTCWNAPLSDFCVQDQV